MRLLATALAVLCLGGLTLLGCGAKTDKLSEQDAGELANSRSDLDDALDTAETLRTSDSEARRLRARVQKIIGDGSLEGKGKPDEFGLAALGRLRDLAPSLVVEDGGSVRALDGEETSAFLTYAVKDPARALYPAAQREVANIERVTGGEDVGPDTKIPKLRDQTVKAYLREAQRDTRSLWPSLSRRLAKAREGL
ncbi:MAG: hypothetical protein WKF49_04400 [Thermoleophilaceae bacterium]